MAWSYGLGSHRVRESRIREPDPKKRAFTKAELRAFFAHCDDEVARAPLGAGDLRDHARDLAMTTPAAELREAYQVTAAMTAWADDACTAAEQEIAAGRPGDAVT